jgi:hypothetical protein
MGTSGWRVERGTIGIICRRSDLAFGGDNDEPQTSARPVWVFENEMGHVEAKLVRTDGSAAQGLGVC